MKLQNPWGKYEWKGIFYVIKDVGAIILMFGANN